MTAHWRGIALLLLVTAIWGSTFAVMKLLTEHLSTPQLIAARFSVAALATLPLLALLRPKTVTTPPERDRSLWRDGLILGLWQLAGLGTQVVALQTTSSNRAAFFTALSVVLVPLWLVLAQRRRLPLLLWIALPLAVAGLALLSWEGGAWVSGDGWALVCALMYVGYIVALEAFAPRHDATWLTFVQVLAVAALAWLWAAAQGSAHLPPRETWGPLIYLGVLATAMTTLLQTIGQRTVSAAEAAIIYSLEPVFATVFSFALLHEQVGQRGALGGLFVVVATVLSQRADLGPPVPETTEHD